MPSKSHCRETMASSERTFDELFKTAIDETRRVQNMPPDEYTAWRRNFTLLPPSISLGDGSHIDTTMEALNAIGEIGLLWLKNTPSAHAVISAEELRALSISIFGQVIGGKYKDRFEADPKFKRVFKSILSERITALSTTTMHYFPCHIFEYAGVPPFAIGPVRFLPRLEWLDVVEATAQSEVGWIPQLRAYWKGEAARPTAPTTEVLGLEPDERQVGVYHQWRAKSICDEVGRCAWIAVVEIPGRLAKLSRTCAEVAVRVAVDAFGLALRHRDALDLRGPGDFKDPNLSHQLLQTQGRDLLESSMLDMPGLKGDLRRHQSLLADTVELRCEAGKAIQAFVDHNAPGAVPGLKKRWVEAMYWFGEARREAAGFISLVKTGISLDVLTQGKKAGGILALCSALFGLKDSDRVLSNGKTLFEVVSAIYDEGRSQLSHGGRLGLLEEIPISKEIALEFTAVVMRKYLECLVKYAGPDDIDDFIAEIPNLRV